jgi:hypothetical protein
MISDATPAYVRSSLVFTFSPNPDIQRHIAHFEAHLGSFFETQFQSLPVPAQMPLEIPRIVGQSPSKHSKLLISANRLEIQTAYDEDFLHHLPKIQDYLSGRFQAAFEALAEIQAVGFAAYILESDYFFPFKTATELHQELFRYTQLPLFPKHENLHDFALSYSLPWQETFFLNVHLSKIHSSLFVENEAGEKVSPDLAETGLKCVVDFNSKYSQQKGRAFNQSVAEQLHHQFFKLMSNHHLNHFLTGEFQS